MSNTKNKIQEDIKTAMRAQDKKCVGALRLITAAIKQFEVDHRVEATDEKIIELLDKLAKQRRESLEFYHKAERQDLVDKEQYELDIILSYLPQALSSEELQTLIENAIKETGASSIKDLGKLMNILKPQLLGRADLSAVSAQLKARLS